MTSLAFKAKCAQCYMTLKDGPYSGHCYGAITQMDAGYCMCLLYQLQADVEKGRSNMSKELVSFARYLKSNFTQDELIERAAQHACESLMQMEKDKHDEVEKTREAEMKPKSGSNARKVKNRDRSLNEDIEDYVEDEDEHEKEKQIEKGIFNSRKGIWHDFAEGRFNFVERPVEDDDEDGDKKPCAKDEFGELSLSREELLYLDKIEEDAFGIKDPKAKPHHLTPNGNNDESSTNIPPSKSDGLIPKRKKTEGYCLEIQRLSKTSPREAFRTGLLDEDTSGSALVSPPGKASVGNTVSDSGQRKQPRANSSRSKEASPISRRKLFDEAHSLTKLNATSDKKRTKGSTQTVMNTVELLDSSSDSEDNNHEKDQHEGTAAWLEFVANEPGQTCPNDDLLAKSLGKDVFIATEEEKNINHGPSIEDAMRACKEVPRVWKLAEESQNIPLKLAAFGYFDGPVVINNREELEAIIGINQIRARVNQPYVFVANALQSLRILESQGKNRSKNLSIHQAMGLTLPSIRIEGRRISTSRKMSTTAQMPLETSTPMDRALKDEPLVVETVDDEDDDNASTKALPNSNTEESATKLEVKIQIGTAHLAPNNTPRKATTTTRNSRINTVCSNPYQRTPGKNESASSKGTDHLSNESLQDIFKVVLVKLNPKGEVRKPRFPLMDEGFLRDLTALHNQLLHCEFDASSDATYSLIIQLSCRVFSDGRRPSSDKVETNLRKVWNLCLRALSRWDASTFRKQFHTFAESFHRQSQGRK